MNCRASLVSAAAILVAGCSGSGHALPPSTSWSAPVVSSAPDGSGPEPIGVPATAATSMVAATCDSSTPIVDNEVQGVSAGASIYGLLFLTHRPPIRVGDEVKIVWRMTGEGNLSVTSTSPTAQPGVLTFGPEPHAGSTYTRPGDEWGTGFLFDEPGCWQIHLERTAVSGDVWFNVTAA